MKYIVLDSFKARTKDGEALIEPGQVVTLPPDKAMKLITEGKVSPAERTAFRVFSEILQAHLWVVYGPEDIPLLRAQGIMEAVYTGEEIAKLRDLPKSELRTIHEAKEIFPSSLIEEIPRIGKGDSE